jgi:hypothetical protein
MKRGKARARKPAVAKEPKAKGVKPPKQAKMAHRAKAQ